MQKTGARNLELIEMYGNNFWIVKLTAPADFGPLFAHSKRMTEDQINQRGGS